MKCYEEVVNIIYGYIRAKVVTTGPVWVLIGEYQPLIYNEDVLK